MASQGRNSERERSKPIKYFILDGVLYKRLHYQHGADILTAWNYPEHKRVGLDNSYVKRRAERAYTTKQVAKMFSRKRLSIQLAIMRGDIPAPQKTYGLQGDVEGRVAYPYMWGEKDIMAAHEYFGNLHRGRPRKDGLITTVPIPNRQEMRALIRQERILYVKTEDGDYVPTWRAREI